MAEPPGHDGRGVKSLKPAALRQAVQLLTRTELTLKQDYVSQCGQSWKGYLFCCAINPWGRIYRRLI